MNGSSRNRVLIEALHGAERRGRRQHGDQRREDAPARRGQERRGQHARQAQHRAHRQVDAGGDDDEGHAERDDAGLGNGAHDVGDVVGCEEQHVAVAHRRGDDAAGQHQHQADDALEAHHDRQQIAAARARHRNSCGLRLGGRRRRQRPPLRPRRPRTSPRCVRAAAPRCGRTAPPARAARSTPPARRGRTPRVPAAARRSRPWRRHRRRASARPAAAVLARAAIPSRTPLSAGCRPTGCRPGYRRAAGGCRTGGSSAPAPRSRRARDIRPQGEMRASTDSTTLRRTLWRSISPAPRRSSVTIAKPARRAAAIEPRRAGRPATSTAPRQRPGGAAPYSADSNSVRPAPMMPASPTISPAHTSRLTDSGACQPGRGCSGR